MDKAAFGASEFGLVHCVQESYGPHKAGLLLNSLGRLFTAYLQFYSGHSCRMEDLLLTSPADKHRHKLIEKAYNKGMRAAKAWAESGGGKAEINESSITDTKLEKAEVSELTNKWLQSPQLTLTLISLHFIFFLLGVARQHGSQASEAPPVQGGEGQRQIP